MIFYFLRKKLRFYVDICFVWVVFAMWWWWWWWCYTFFMHLALQTGNKELSSFSLHDWSSHFFSAFLKGLSSQHSLNSLKSARILLFVSFLAVKGNLSFWKHIWFHLWQKSKKVQFVILFLPALCKVYLICNCFTLWYT